jgi:DNA-binding NarL/FixJ family response regulator
MPLTILVSDDDLGTRLSVSDYLELQGYAVVSAANGQEALKMVNQFHPNLIVTDIAMPQMDGYELIRQVRSQPSLRLLPVVFLTARKDTEDRILGYQLGCDAYLAKPFELSELGAVVRNLLDRMQMMASELQFSRNAVTAAEIATIDAMQHAAEVASNGRSPMVPHLPISAVEVSQREIDVLRLISDGLSNIQIGDRLHLSPRTVEKHVSSLLRKTNANNRAELVRYAIEHHLVS